MHIAVQQYSTVVARHHHLMQALVGIEGPEERTALESALLADTRKRFRGVVNDHASRHPARYRTAAACQMLSEGGRPHREHAVPVNLIHNVLLGIPTPYDGPNPPAVETAESLSAFLQAHLFYVLATPEEHQALPAWHMPQGWTWFANVMQRYIDNGHIWHEGAGCPACA